MLRLSGGTETEASEMPIKCGGIELSATPEPKPLNEAVKEAYEAAMTKLALSVPPEDMDHAKRCLATMVRDTASMRVHGGPLDWRKR